MSQLIGKRAPAIAAEAAKGDQVIQSFSLEDYLGQYVIFFFYPLDFTFVCPTELHAFQEKLEEFEKRGAQVVGCSVDSTHTHLAWLRTPKEDGGIQGIDYPIVADLKKEVARDYQVLKEDEGIAYRGLFLIDREGIVRHALVNDLPLGRSVDEAIRMLDALIFHEKNGEVCPANWHVGEKALNADRDGIVAYFN